jgi:hypothetical protein
MRRGICRPCQLRRAQTFGPKTPLRPCKANNPLIAILPQELLRNQAPDRAFPVPSAKRAAPIRHGRFLRNYAEVPSPYLTTKLKSRPGTKITLTTVLPDR